MLIIVENLRKSNLISMLNDNITVKTFKCPKCSKTIQFKFVAPAKCPYCGAYTSFVDRLIKQLYDRVKYYNCDQIDDNNFHVGKTWHD